MLENDDADDGIDRDWVFERGDQIADEMPQHTRMPGLGEPGPGETVDHDYEVIRRMVDADDGDPMYLVEKPSNEQLVFKADTIRVNFEKVGESDDDGGIER